MSVCNSTLAALFGIPDRVAIVTGAGSGIGKATALLMAKAGGRIGTVDINMAAAEQTAAEIRTEGGEAAAVEADISEETKVRDMAARVADALGGIDILVNNAAYRPKADFMEMSVEAWDHMHAVNTRGVFLCMREAIRVMRRQGRERGGAIVNVSSIGAAHPTIFNNTHYDSSKAGVNAITRTSAAEFAADGIRINAVMPGGVDTEGARKLRQGAMGFVAKGPITMPGRVLLGLAQPIQLASAILFLASPASSYMTGCVMAVDGGYSVG